MQAMLRNLEARESVKSYGAHSTVEPENRGLQ